MATDKSLIPFQYPDSLQKYMVTETAFSKQDPQFIQLVSGAIIFDSDSKMLLVQRAKDEKAFPNLWEIPGGKVDDTDATILHAVAREVKEETGLDVTRFVRKVGEHGWQDSHKPWVKLNFEVEVEGLHVKLDEVEHQDYLFATEEEVLAERSGEVALTFISQASKEMIMEAFRLRREAGQVMTRGGGTGGFADGTD